MKIFRISSSGWEIYGQHTLTHPNKGNLEFKEDCVTAARQALVEITGQMDEDNSLAYTNAYNLMEKSLPILMNMGYSMLEIDEDYYMPGDDGGLAFEDDSNQEELNEFGQEYIDFKNKAKKTNDEFLSDIRKKNK